MPTHFLSDLPVRRLSLRDVAACADLSEGRGWGREEYKWGLLLAAGTGYGIDAPDGGLVCACTVTEYGPADGSPSRQRPALSSIGMVLVAERYEGQGVGTRLMSGVLASTGPSPFMLYATASGRPLYDKLGFKALGRAETLRGYFLPGGAATTARARTRPATADDLQAIVRLDHEVFGVDRTHILTRLPSFSDLLRVAEVEGYLAGYAAAWPNNGSHVIGPLVARDTAVAKALVASLAAATDRPLRTDIEVRHEELRSWLTERGLRATDDNTLMVYGANELPGDACRRFAPLTVAMG